MPLIRDQRQFELEGFEGVYFWMRDGANQVLCLIGHDDLRVRAARDAADASLEDTFLRHRELIERIAGANYDAGPMTENVLRVRGEQLTPLPM
jgi:hypothetical protein